MVGLLLVAGGAVAAFVPAELCPDLLVAAGSLTHAGRLAATWVMGVSFSHLPCAGPQMSGHSPFPSAPMFSCVSAVYS